MIHTVQKVKLTHHKGKLVVHVRWPDKLRSRFRVSSEEKGTELKLQIQLAIVDGSWNMLRATLQEKDPKPELIAARLSAVIDEYFDWVKIHNRSVATKKTFLDRFKKRVGHLPIRSLQLRHSDKYVSWREEAGVKNSTINRELACLRHLS